MDEPLGFELYSGTTAGGTGTAHEVFADRLGSVIKVVEAATGTVVSDQRFDSFGQRTATGPLLQRYGFTGREHDAESGLLYFRARAYDPEIGQFLQRDPTGFAAGDLNLYAYTWNDPYNWRDPSGLGAVENTTLSAGVIGLGLAVTGSAVCIATEPCRKGVSRGASGIAGGVLALMGNMWAAANEAFDRWFSKSNPEGGGNSADGNGGANSPGAAGNDNTGVASTPPGGPDDDGDDGPTFGRNDNQKSHTWRHIDRAGLDRTAVRNEIVNDLRGQSSTYVRREITVNGTRLEYRAFFIKGRYNVGTIFPK